jgi:hypothetical protein
MKAFCAAAAAFAGGADERCCRLVVAKKNVL